MPLWLQGAVELALVALVSYITVGLMLTAVWYTNGFNTDTVAGALSVAGHIWLLVHGVPLNMNIPAQGSFSAVSGTMSLVPLGLTLIPLALCYRSGRRLARASYEGQFWEPLVGGMVAYSLVSAGISLISTDDYFTTSPVLAAIIPLWVTALGILAGGFAESRSLAAMIGVDAADWVKKFSQYSRWAGSYIWAMVRASLVGVMAYVAGGSLLLVTSLFVHWDKVVGLYQALHSGAVGGFALTLLQLGLLLNLVIYSMAWSSGAGFSLGVGTSVGPTGTSVGIMPSLPVLGALPHTAEPWGYIGLAVPLIAGAVGGWWFFREGENHFDEWLSLKIRFRWISWPLSTLGLAALAFIPSFILLFLLGWAAHGSLGLGRFTEVGPSPLLFGACGALLLVLGLIIGLGLAHLLVRDSSLELERFADQKPTRAQKKQAKAEAKAKRVAERAEKKKAAAAVSDQGEKDEYPAGEEEEASENSPETEPNLAHSNSPMDAPREQTDRADKDLADAEPETEPETDDEETEKTDSEAEAPKSLADAEERQAEPTKKSAPVVKRPKSLRRRWNQQLQDQAEEEPKL
ncbi:DUF6350 family protein [Rothia sp. CCM 9416]|uniref:cell division protein PerM n=1 Tax=Rothia sp. CCM 9416 TaxID=3402655 RepID=UPI003AEAAC23